MRTRTRMAWTRTRKNQDEIFEENREAYNVNYTNGQRNNNAGLNHNQRTLHLSYYTALYHKVDIFIVRQ